MNQPQQATPAAAPKQDKTTPVTVNLSIVYDAPIETDMAGLNAELTKVTAITVKAKELGKVSGVVRIGKRIIKIS